jgi:hypothetical protein
MFNETPKLASSSDYPRWAQTVSAYLGVQKALKVITKSPPVLNTVGSNQDELDTWEELKGLAWGVIILSLHPTITKAVDPAKMVKEVWDEVKLKYGKPGPSGIYLKFKKVLATDIPGNADPSLALKTLHTSFSKMKALSCEVPHKIQVLMYMSKLSAPCYEHIVQNISTTDDLNKVKIDELERIVQLAWESKASKKPAPQVNKISAVKCAPGEQSFSGQQENQGEGSRSRPRRGGKKKQAARLAEAEQAPEEEHAQLACPIFTPPIFAPPPVVVAPLPPSISFFPAFNKAQSLSNRIGVPATVQTLERLEMSKKTRDPCPLKRACTPAPKDDDVVSLGFSDDSMDDELLALASGFKNQGTTVGIVGVSRPEYAWNII